jgi:ABC-type multidrug transport system ATPase subunit
MSVIRVSNLSKNFGTNIKAVDGLSFSVPPGLVYGFLGQNGAGKSTTIRMLLTLIRPDEGDIEVFGLNLARHRKEILQRVGAMIERPDMYKYLTAMENLRLFANMSGLRPGNRQLTEQLALVGLADRAHSKVKTYSQGMRQRLGIAIALVHDPDLIILDEPTNGLDPQGIADIRRLILHLARDRHKTLVVSSHLLAEMEMIADQMLIINKGRKVVEGNTRSLLNPEKIRIEIMVDDPSKTISIIKGSPWSANLLPSDNSGVMLEMEQGSVPDLTRLLVTGNVNIFSITPRHSLEEFFLSVTGT